MSSNPNEITYFGETDYRNKKTRFGIKASDRTRHVYVIGKSGMGKSTLLENMAVQDIQNGNGFAFIDPHGGTAEKLLEYIPEERMQDVIYFAPFDMEYPVAFNVMEDVGYDNRHLVVSGLMSAFEKIWADAWSARMSYILQNTLFALLEYPDSTLLDINRMLADKDFRKKVVDNITDSTVKSYWVDEFAKYSEQYARDATPAIQNKVGQFALNPLIRNIIGQPKSSFDMRKIMDEKKILIMNLSKGRMGDTNTRLLGSMLITKIYLAAMSRADLSHAEIAQKPNFYFYVDEFQSFANKSFAEILSEARKYKLNLTIAHQYVEQMEDEVRSAVFGNVGTMITFRVGSYDAEIFEKEFAPEFTAEDFVNLDFTQIYLKLMIDGIGSKPFSATSLPSIEIPESSNMDKVIAASRAQFATPRAVVEEFIQKRQEGMALNGGEKKTGKVKDKEKSMTPLEKKLNDIRKGKATTEPSLNLNTQTEITGVPAAHTTQKPFEKQQTNNKKGQQKTEPVKDKQAEEANQPFKDAFKNRDVFVRDNKNTPRQTVSKQTPAQKFAPKKAKDSENKNALKDALAGLLEENKKEQKGDVAQTVKPTQDSDSQKTSIPPSAPRPFKKHVEHEPHPKAIQPSVSQASTAPQEQPKMLADQVSKIEPAKVEAQKVPEPQNGQLPSPLRSTPPPPQISTPAPQAPAPPTHVPKPASEEQKVSKQHEIKEIPEEVLRKVLG